MNGGHRLIAFCLATIVLGAQLGSQPALAAYDLHVCGRITAFTAASPKEEGSIKVGTRLYRIGPGGRYLEMHAHARVGDVRCIRGESDAQGRLSEFWAYTVSSSGWPTPLMDGGVVAEIAYGRGNDPATLTFADGSSYRLARDSAVPIHVIGHEIYVGLAIREDGDAEVIGWSAGPSLAADASAPYDGACGTVLHVSLPTPETPGALTVGDRAFTVAAGITLGWGLVADQGTGLLGRNICLSGIVGQRETLIAYSVTDLFPMNAFLCGVVFRYDPVLNRIDIDADTVGRDGSHRVRNGTAMPDVFTGRTCFGLDVASDGVAEITSVLGFVPTGPETTASPAPSQVVDRLPSTSTRAMSGGTYAAPAQPTRTRGPAEWGRGSPGCATDQQAVQLPLTGPPIADRGISVGGVL
jgi:hypothetical protein